MKGGLAAVLPTSAGRAGSAEDTCRLIVTPSTPHLPMTPPAATDPLFTNEPVAEPMRRDSHLGQTHRAWRAEGICGHLHGEGRNLHRDL